MAHLPISGLQARWHPETGRDDLDLLEHPCGLEAAVRHASRAVRAADGSDLDVAGLPVGDVERLIVQRRRERLGDEFVAEGSCGACASPVDVHFSLSAFLGHQRPRRARGAELCGEPGWWRLRGTTTIFRAPSARDVLAASASEAPRRELQARCVRGGNELRRVERALAVLAPTLRADMGGSCPECGAEVVLDVDVRELCLAELGFLARAVLEEVHLIAVSYHWTEATILDLPSVRRGWYSELIRHGRVSPVAMTSRGVLVG
jgi:hypothetical protein